MKRESFQGILLGVVIMCAVFAFITIAWAAFSSTLTIGGTANVQKQSWEVAFVDSTSASDSGSTAITISNKSKSGLAEYPSSSGLSINGDISGATHSKVVSGNIGTLKQEGDELVYVWYIKNFGTFDAAVSVNSTNSNVKASGSISNNNNITLVCTEDKVSPTTGDLDSWCASNITTSLYITSGIPASTDPRTLLNSASTYTLGKAGSSSNGDLLEVKLIISYTGSVANTGSNADPNEVSDKDVIISVEGIKLDAAQNTGS